MNRYYIIDEGTFRYTVYCGQDWPRGSILGVYVTLRGAKRAIRKEQKLDKNRRERADKTIIYDTFAEEVENDLDIAVRRRGLFVKDNFDE
jgi:hypothetical protein